MLRHIGWIALGGALGATARVLVVESAQRWLGAAFPYGTVLVNAVGSLALGALVGAVVREAGISASVRAGVGAGFLGAFTTFSTYAVETVVLADRPSVGAALANVVVSNGLALLAAAAGYRLTAG